MTRLALLATILILASGCDKAKEIGGVGRNADAAEPPAGERFDIASRPDVVFQIFGERDDPRMIPIAALVDGTLKPIKLGAQGWREFDSLYTRSGKEVAIYHGGQKVGTAKVRQGMWEKANALYSLPGCKLLTPLAAVSLEAPNEGYTVEYLASTAKLGNTPAGRPLAKDAAARTARALGHAVGRDEGLSPARLDSLDFFGTSIATGASSEPTVIASFIDPGAQGDATADSKAAHVFVIADRSGADYSPTFSHAVNGPANSAEYRRYVDHADFTGDGVSEIVLEAWQYGGDTQLLILAWRNGRWEEIYRGRPSWCLDARR
jgi:hypothetical protein